MYENIPSVNLADFTSGDSFLKDRFVASLGKAFSETGFVAVKGHGLTKGISDDLYDAFVCFFNMSDEQKSVYDVPGLFGQRGYTGKGKEHAKGRNVGDLKEFFHVGQPDIPSEPQLVGNYYPNIWPTEIPKLESVSLQAFRTLESTGVVLLRAISLYLGLEENYFDAKVRQGNSILRAIHYYPIEKEAPEEEAVRAAAHEDINLITLLMGASAEGLEILRKDGFWIPVTALPGQIIVNVGDMLARLTNDVMRSTTHRVVNPKEADRSKPRYSMPFFMHPRADMDLTCLSSCVNDRHPKKYTDLTAGEFLDERLREIGLKK